MRRLPRFHVYLLLSDRGEVYAGYTGNLRRRFKEHNAADNEGWTKGRRWRLLAVRCFLDRHSAVIAEKQLKRSKYDKRNRIHRERRRYSRLRRSIAAPHATHDT